MMVQTMKVSPFIRNIPKTPSFVSSGHSALRSCQGPARAWFARFTRHSLPLGCPSLLNLFGVLRTHTIAGPSSPSLVCCARLGVCGSRCALHICARGLHCNSTRWDGLTCLTRRRRAWGGQRGEQGSPFVVQPVLPNGAVLACSNPCSFCWRKCQRFDAVLARSTRVARPPLTPHVGCCFPESC